MPMLNLFYRCKPVATHEARHVQGLVGACRFSRICEDSFSDIW
jgi:hypothetical protein